MQDIRSCHLAQFSPSKFQQKSSKKREVSLFTICSIQLLHRPLHFSHASHVARTYHEQISLKLNVFSAMAASGQVQGASGSHRGWCEKALCSPAKASKGIITWGGWLTCLRLFVNIRICKYVCEFAKYVRESFECVSMYQILKKSCCVSGFN